jgi:hypothetical protein
MCPRLPGSSSSLEMHRAIGVHAAQALAHVA